MDVGPLDMNALDAFSRTFAELLFVSHPDWVKCATGEREASDPYEYLSVVIPGESQADLKDPLWITTEQNGVTVGIDTYHQHFNDWSSGVDSTDALGVHRAALKFVEEIIAEEIAVVSIWSNDMNAGAWCEPKDRAMSMTAKDVAAGISGSSVWTPLPDRPVTSSFLRIRSWKGSLNRELPLPS